MTWRRVESEFEADLYKVPPPRFFLFRGSVGEAEVKRYSSGEARLEVKFYGLKVPDGTTVSVLIDGALVTEMPIRRQRGYLDETAPESERPLPVVSRGSLIEVQHNGVTVLKGTFYRD